MGECFGIVNVSQDVTPFFAHDDGGAGVLAGGKQTGGGGDGVLQVGVNHEAVVVGGFGIVELFAEAGEVGGAEIKGDVVEGGFGEQGEGVRGDLEKGFAGDLDRMDEVRGEEAERGVAMGVMGLEGGFILERHGGVLCKKPGGKRCIILGNEAMEGQGRGGEC